MDPPSARYDEESSPPPTTETNTNSSSSTTVVTVVGLGGSVRKLWWKPVLCCIPLLLQVLIFNKPNTDVRNVVLLFSNPSTLDPSSLASSSSSSSSSSLPESSSTLSKSSSTVVTQQQQQQPSFQIQKKSKSLFVTCDTGNNKKVTMPRSFPHFIIVGAQKAGTTAISDLLSKVVDVGGGDSENNRISMIPTSRIERHYWDNIQEDPQTWSDTKRCIQLNHYWSSWNKTIGMHEEQQHQLSMTMTTMMGSSNMTTNNNSNNNNSKRKRNQRISNVITYEKTPSLLMMNHVPRYIRSAFQWRDESSISIVDEDGHHPRHLGTNDDDLLPKILVILRNPVDRAISWHKMMWQRSGSPSAPNDDDNNTNSNTTSSSFQFFDEFALQSVNKLRSKNIIQAPPPPPPSSSSVVDLNNNNNNNNNNRSAVSNSSSSSYEYDPNDFHVVPLEQRYKLKVIDAIKRGFYAEQLVPYIDVFGNKNRDRDNNNTNTIDYNENGRRIYRNKNLMVILYEDFLRDKSTVLSDILEFATGGSKEARYHNLSNDILDRDLGPTSYANRKNAAGGRTYPKPSPQMKEYLKLMYKPVNDQLADLLGEPWRGVWD